MKAKIRQLRPNPFKKWINNGKLNKEQIEKLRSNIKELKLMGSIPVVKKNNELHLVSHHHRVEALRKEFGDNYEVEITLHNYSDEQLFRGMVIENLTQREGDFREEIENITAIRKYLQTTCLDSKHVVKRPQGGGSQPINGSTRDIRDWLNKNGEVMSINKIAELLNINDRLAPEIKANITKTHTGDISQRGEKTSYTQAIMLSSIPDHKEQKDLDKVLKKSMEQRVREQSKLLSKYKTLPDDQKSKIRKGEVDIANIDDMIMKEEYKGNVEIKIDKTPDDYADEIISVVTKLFPLLGIQYAEEQRKKLYEMIAEKIPERKKVVLLYQFGVTADSMKMFAKSIEEVK